MTLTTARQLCHLRQQQDWAQLRLDYISPALYGDDAAARGPAEVQRRA